MSFLLVLATLFTLNIYAQEDYKYDPVGGEVTKTVTTKLSDGSKDVMEEGIFLNCIVTEDSVCVKAVFAQVVRETIYFPDGTVDMETATFYSDLNSALVIDVQKAQQNKKELRKFLRTKMKRKFPLTNKAFYLSGGILMNAGMLPGLLVGLITIPTAFAAEVAIAPVKAPVVLLSNMHKAQKMLEHMLGGIPGAQMKAKFDMKLMIEKIIKMDEKQLSTKELKFLEK